jgi:hypothetical protein
MQFDWVLFLAISVLGPYFGSKLCAALEKAVTGKVRNEKEFRSKRIKSTLFSIAISYLSTVKIIKIISENTSLDIALLTTGMSIVIGVVVYLCVQRVIYRILLLNYHKHVR